MAFIGSPVMISRSSFGPRLSFLRFDFGFDFFGMSYNYHIGLCLPHWKWCPSRGSDPEARNGRAVANRACLPVPALGHMKKN
jgi:hypothetical protein